MTVHKNMGFFASLYTYLNLVSSAILLVPSWYSKYHFSIYQLLYVLELCWTARHKSHRITVIVWVAADLEKSSSANSQPKAGTSYTVWLLKAPYKLASNNSSYVASITSLGNLSQYFPNFIVNNLFLMSNLNLTIPILK